MARSLDSPSTMAASPGFGIRVLFVHATVPTVSGEDIVVEREMAALKRRGLDVRSHTIDVAQAAKANALRLAAEAVWNVRAGRAVRQVLNEWRPDVLYVHGLMPFFSPSILWTAKKNGVSTVMLLHNYRLVCLNGLLLRDGRACEDCVGGSVLSGVRHKCYRQSFAASSSMAAAVTLHRVLRLLHPAVDRYIALTSTAAERFTRSGMPRDKVVVRPNFVPDPGPVGSAVRDGVVFVGRLSEEKGVDMLLRAYACDRRLPRLTVIGDGPLRGHVESAAQADSRITFRGRQQPEEILRVMGATKALCLPSTCYESCPLVALEALSTGTPVVGWRDGALGDLLSAPLRALTYPTTTPAAIAERIRFVDQMTSAAYARLSEHATGVYRERFSEEHISNFTIRLFQDIVGDARRRAYV